MTSLGKILGRSQDLLGICDPKPETYDPKSGLGDPIFGLFDLDTRIPRVTLAGYPLAQPGQIPICL